MASQKRNTAEAPIPKSKKHKEEAKQTWLITGWTMPKKGLPKSSAMTDTLFEVGKKAED